MKMLMTLLTLAAFVAAEDLPQGYLDGWGAQQLVATTSSTIAENYKYLKFIEKNRDQLDGKIYRTLRGFALASMNTSLSVGNTMRKNVKVNAVLLMPLLAVSSPNDQIFFVRFDKERKANGWISADEKEEAEIQEIIDLYKAYGNPFGVENVPGVKAGQ